MIEFALDSTIPSVCSQLLERIRETRHLNWWALIDTVFDYQKTAFPQHAGSINCYSDFTLDDLRPAAPCLLPIERGRAAQWLPSLIEHCDARPMLSFFATSPTVTGEQLVEQWLPYHWVSPSEGSPLLLRVADTRTLAILPKVLSPVQWKAWYQNIDQWHIIDRRGRLAELPKPETEDKLPTKIEIDNQQFALFLELSEADAALDSLLTESKVLLPSDITGYQFYTQATQALAQATRDGIEGWPDRADRVLKTIRPDIVELEL